MKKCKMLGCEKVKRKNGFCVNHNYHYKKGNLDIEGNWLKEVNLQIYQRYCKIKNCKNNSEVNGYCLDCYRNYILGYTDIRGDKLTRLIKEDRRGLIYKKLNDYQKQPVKVEKRTTKIALKNNPQKKECKVLDCNSRMFTKGYCKKHYRWLLNRKIEDNTTILKECGVKGCDKFVEYGNFCISHTTYYKTGYLDNKGSWIKNPGRVRNVYKFDKCLISDCGNKVLAKGLCQKHYSQYIRAENVGWIKKRYFNNNSFTCKDCGKEFLFGQIDFHHENEKTFKVGEKINSITFITNKKIKEELDNGVWLCARCHMARHYDINKSYHEVRKDKTRAKNIDLAYRRIIENIGYNCEICGDILLPREMEFHHKKDKEKYISHMVGWQKIDTILKELNKCTLVCRNCHRLLHLLDNRDTVLDINYFNNLFKLNNVKYLGKVL